MAHRQILTEDELAMLRDLEGNQDTHVLNGHLDAPMLGLLHKAKHLVLEAHFAGHQLRFPLTLIQGEDGFVEPHLCAPVIKELGFTQPRAWRLAQQATLCSDQGVFQIVNLSLNGLMVEDLPTDMVVGDPIDGELCIEQEEPFPLRAKLVRHIRFQTSHATWALSFQMCDHDMERLRHWLFQRHQDAFSEAYHT